MTPSYPRGLGDTNILLLLERLATDQLPTELLNGCGLSASCGTCMPLAAKYRQARAPLERFCQHGKKKEVTAWPRYP
jgi:hypothetical protein